MWPGGSLGDGGRDVLGDGALSHPQLVSRAGLRPRLLCAAVLLVPAVASPRHGRSAADEVELVGVADVRDQRPDSLGVGLLSPQRRPLLDFPDVDWRGAAPGRLAGAALVMALDPVPGVHDSAAGVGQGHAGPTAAANRHGRQRLRDSDAWIALRSRGDHDPVAVGSPWTWSRRAAGSPC